MHKARTYVTFVINILVFCDTTRVFVVNLSRRDGHTEYVAVEDYPTIFANKRAVRSRRRCNACCYRCRCNREAALRAESGMRRMLGNPFKSIVPLVGDYDISVVIEALKLRECRISLHVVFNPTVRGVSVCSVQP